jgi:hypothetical protein
MEAIATEFNLSSYMHCSYLYKRHNEVELTSDLRNSEGAKRVRH